MASESYQTARSRVEPGRFADGPGRPASLQAVDYNRRMSVERERISQVLFYATILLVGYLTYQVISPFLVPLGWAGVLAVCVYPTYQRLVPRLGRTWGAVATTILVLVLLVVPVWLIGMALVREGGPAISALKDTTLGTPPAWAVRTWNWLQAHVPELAPNNLMESLSAAGQQVLRAVASTSGAVLGGVALLIVDLIITLFALFFFLRDAPGIQRRIRGMLPFREAERDRILTQVGDLIYASVTAGLAVAAIQGLLGGLAFWALGVGAPVVWGTVMAFFALIPVAGAWVIWLPVAIWLLATGDVTRGLILIGLGAGVISMVDNVLRPILLSGRSSMSGLVTFIALLGGVAAFGFIGLIFGPVVIAIAMSLFDPTMRTGDIVEPRETDPVWSDQG
jgi:predicted PurR-regulated permease PerM